MSFASVRWFRLYRSRADLVLTSGKRQSLPIHWCVISGARRFRFRYQRPTFVCACGRRALKVFLHRGEFTCKRCSGAVYACQVASGVSSRARLQATRLRSFINGYPVEADRVPDKPLWWHWESYERLIGKLAQLQARAARRGRHSRKSKRITERMLRPLLEYDVRSERD
jgi:hypothetical protein